MSAKDLKRKRNLRFRNSSIQVLSWLCHVVSQRKDTRQMSIGGESFISENNEPQMFSYINSDHFIHSHLQLPGWKFNQPDLKANAKWQSIKARLRNQAVAGHSDAVVHFDDACKCSHLL